MPAPWRAVPVGKSIPGFRCFTWMPPSPSSTKGPAWFPDVPAPNCDLSALSILADYLAGKLKSRDRKVAAKTLPPAYHRLRPSPVHRLDQYTTGVFCMATSPAARQHLIEQLKAHTMKREYVAYIEGRPGEPKGSWRQWLQPSRDKMRQLVLEDASPGHQSRGTRPSRITRSSPNSRLPATSASSRNCGFGSKRAGSAKSASRPPMPDSPWSATAPTTRPFGDWTPLMRASTSHGKRCTRRSSRSNTPSSRGTRMSWRAENAQGPARTRGRAAGGHDLGGLPSPCAGPDQTARVADPGADLSARLWLCSSRRPGRGFHSKLSA